MEYNTVKAALRILAFAVHWLTAGGLTIVSFLMPDEKRLSAYVVAGQDAVITEDDPARILADASIASPITSYIQLPLISEDAVVGRVELFRLSTADPPLNFPELRECSMAGGASLREAWETDQDHDRTLRDPHCNARTYAWLLDTLDLRIKEGNRECDEFSIISLDTRGLKRKNEEIGHVMCDRLLARLVAFLESELRGADAVARFAGDEFILSCPNTPYFQALLLAQDLQKRVAEHTFAVPTGDDADGPHVTIPLEIYVGVASYPLHGRTPEALVKSALDAMMENKRKGNS